MSRKDMLAVGGNTACIQLTSDGEDCIVLDAGTGIRELGNALIRQEKIPSVIHILITHTHWDHISGFPFFAPAYKKDFKIIFYGHLNASANLEAVIKKQLSYEYFPVTLENMSATFQFIDTGIGTFQLTRDIQISTQWHEHPNKAITYRISEKGKNFVYTTDAEHDPKHLDPRVVEIAKNADILVHDAQYTPEVLTNKKGYGHSSWRQATDVARIAKVKRLYLFHHDPEHNDEFLRGVELEAQKKFPLTFLAKEGEEFNI